MEKSLLFQNIENSNLSGLVIAGLKGGSGKTLFSVGVVAALKNDGLSVVSFKKGPDYIDAGWLSFAAGGPCFNLDLYLMRREVVLESYLKNARCFGISVVEGNRGLYDCVDFTGETSTAALAKLLDLPVVLCVDATKTTRTMAAVILGMLNFDSDVRIAGIVLNRVAGDRHRRILSKSIEYHCGIPVLGSIPKLNQKFLPERHMGLIPTMECKRAEASVQFAAKLVRKYFDIGELLRIAGLPSAYGESESPINSVDVDSDRAGILCTNTSSIVDDVEFSISSPIVGVLLDSAFQFYYPENLDSLRKEGARLVFISPIKDISFPNVDALYIGGGFPEVYAGELESNFFMRRKIKQLAELGLPIYAECGGLIYLGERLFTSDGNVFEMTGVFSASFKISERPLGHGYTVVNVDRENPYYQVGSRLLGHEFHYSSMCEWNGKKERLAFSMERGSGFVDGKDGLFYKNVLASYTHVHALGTVEWAKILVEKSRNYMNLNRVKTSIIT